MTMTKQMLKAKIVDIAEMDSVELEKFKIAISMSDVDEKAKFFLYRAVDVREAELNRRDAIVEDGEIAIGETE